MKRAVRLLTPTTLLIGFLLLALSIPAHAEGSTEDWTQWRGPRRDGGVGGGSWPDSLSGLRPQWRVPLGPGYPGPIVAGQRVFVVESATGETVAVRALDRRSGDEIWARSWPGSGSVPFFARSNGDWVRSTPTYDAELLFVGDMQEVLVALDAASGKERWRVDFPERFGTPVPDFGFASSPLVHGDHLYVQAADSLVKLETGTGKTVWRKLEHAAEIQASGAFSSPILATIGGRQQLVVLSRHTLFGTDPDSGDVLWSRDVPNFRGMNILTPVVYGDAVFTSPYKGQSYLFTVRRDGEQWIVDEAWTNKAWGYMSTPVVIEDHVYLHLGNRRVDCIDLKTGESRWRSEPFGRYWSMTYQGDKILALDESGWLYLLRADPAAFRMLDSKQVSEEESWGHLAVSGEQLFVRELKAIAAYSWGDPGEAGQGPSEASTD